MKQRPDSRVIVLTFAVLASGSLATRAATRDFGVDVSPYQNETGVPQTNWNQMFAEGNRFVYAKATEGITFVDTTMGANVTRATVAGLRAGVYHFAHPELSLTPSGASQEADYLLSHAGNSIGPGYLRPVLDLETGSNLGATALTDWVIAFVNEIISNRGPGAAPIIYVTQTYAFSALDTRISNFDLWIATQGTGLNPATDNPGTGVFSNWSFWQYNTATAGGISPIDLDVCHSEFKTLDSFLIPAAANPLPPVIIGQPLSRTVRVGNNATFSVAVAVSSSTPLSYQWRFNGMNIAGATTTVYTQLDAQLTNTGNYTVVITNAAGSVTSSVAALTVNPPPPVVPPVVLYQENFDAYASPSVVSSPATTNGFKLLFGAASGPVDFTARFGFDYSTVTIPAVIPSAPHSSGGTTKGLYLTVNKDATPAVAAVNLYPVSQVFTGNFALKFDLWINYSNIAASTEHALFGINHSGNVTNRVGQLTSDGLFFAMDGDGGVSASTTLRDFALFRGGGPAAIPVLLTTGNTVFGPQPLLGANFDSADAGFSALFPSKALSTFTTASGSAGNGWVSVEVLQATNVITWLLNDTMVAQYTNTSLYTNGNILIGYNDAFASIGGADNFAVFDNIRVETLPDLDGNGLPDTWELQYFGHMGVDPDADADGDGVSNYQEYLAGTNPTNAASVFRLLRVARVNDDVRLDWTTVGGHSYVAQTATNLGPGSSGNFVDLGPPIPVDGTTEGTTNYVDAGAAINQGRYYRVRLGP
jgi:GH25 family lysozyme M1 (1,4-beta-N-acetylmuramidase)